MTRTQALLQVPSLVIAATMAAVPVLAAAPAPSVQASASIGTQAGERRPVDLSQGWTFRFGEAPGAVTQSGFDDDDWEKVSVPHSWNRIGSYSIERQPESNNAQGIGWYRLTVPASAGTAQADMRRYLDFAAVSKIADVWVNGKHVGTHKGAFARFRIDVTKVWKAGGDNLVVVRADNSKVEPGSATAQVIPLSGDFFVHGGIYRGVSLLELPQASIDPLDYGGPGVYARLARIDDKEALVDVRTRLRAFGPATGLSVETTIRDAGGKRVASAREQAVLTPGSGEATGEVSSRMTIADPHRWNGRADPYLYTVTARLLDGDKVLDTVSQPLGLRTLRVDAQEGFFLNGEHLALHGVSRHQDALGKGWALDREQHKKDMELIEEIGANTVRQAHYQHDDTWSELADEAGMVVWAELPYVTTPSVTGGKGSDALWANAERQLREQIRQNYNHPSIAMWSVGNEVDSAKGFGIEGAPPEPLALLQHLNSVAKEEDPDRPTTFADCCEGMRMIETAGETLTGTADLVGYNRYYGWYYPDHLNVAKQLGETLDKLHAAHPQVPISISEYGAGGATSQHSDDVKSGFLNFIGRPHPEEYQAWLHEQSWPVLSERPFVFASWVWAMFDFSSDLRDEGEAVDLNDKGLVSADRERRKDAFWFYKTAWNDTPSVHLTGKNYVERAYPEMDVKAYARADKASLSVNGRSLGEAPCPEFVCTWEGVALDPGANDAVVSITAQGRTLSDTMTWMGPDPRAQGLAIDVGSLGGRMLGTMHYGSDTFVAGGTPKVLNLSGFGGRRLRPPRSVEAASPVLFDYWREGDAFTYDIPLPAGTWTVTLRFFEPEAREGEGRALKVTAGGKAMIEGLDVQAAAGGPLRELVRSFEVTVAEGEDLRLGFEAKGAPVSLAAIEISS